MDRTEPEHGHSSTNTADAHHPKQSTPKTCTKRGTCRVKSAAQTRILQRVPGLFGTQEGGHFETQNVPWKGVTSEHREGVTRLFQLVMHGE